jgi:DHA1 family bicyclomycin/chloramphenicol resistance-like MFS transporter
LAAALVLPETLAPSARTDHSVVQAMGVYAELLRDSRFLAPGILAGSTYVVLFAYISSSPEVMLDYFGLSEITFALLFGALALCFAVGAQVNRRLLNSFSIVQLIVAFVIVQSVASATLLISALIGPNLVVVSIAVGAAMTTVGVVSANATALCLDPFPRAAGSAAALLGVVGMGVGALVSTTLVVLQVPVVTELGSAMVVGSALGLSALAWIASGKRRGGHQHQQDLPSAGLDRGGV